MKLGILGGGQLGGMLLGPAHNLAIETTILDAKSAPATALSHNHIEGDFNKAEDVKKLAHLDIVTVEIENVSIEGLSFLESKGVKVFPGPTTLKIIQDKGLQKKFLNDLELPIAEFEVSKLSAEDSFKEDKILKLCRGGYDGKGVLKLKTGFSVPAQFATDVVIEKVIPIEKEISLLAARSKNGDIKTYPLIEMVFNKKLNLIDSTFCPANLGDDYNLYEKQAQKIARSILDTLEYVGIMAIEMFIDTNGNLIVNELAPRPHNSGHFSIEACYTSQFEQHIRAIMGYSLGSTSLREPAMTFNLVGSGESGVADYQGIEKLGILSKVFPHLYGKKESRAGRKMGHITLLGSFEHCIKIKEKVEKWVTVTAKK